MAVIKAGLFNPAGMCHMLTHLSLSLFLSLSLLLLSLLLSLSLPLIYSLLIRWPQMTKRSVNMLYPKP
jgi:hypothetical protein